MDKNTAAYRLRHVPGQDDPGTVGALLRATGVFSDEEIALAEKELQDTLAVGSDETGSYYIFLEDEGGLVRGYTSYCPLPITQGCWIFDWVAVDAASKGQGVARILLEAVCTCVMAQSARHLYTETSGLPSYAPARAFYIKSGFVEVARLADYYKPGDDKVIYRKTLP